MSVKKLSKWAPFLSGLAAKLNELIGHTGCLDSIEGTGGITVTKSDTNIKIDGSGIAGDGAGLPPGYTFEEFTICDSGTPATRWWPTWPTNPEA